MAVSPHITHCWCFIGEHSAGARMNMSRVATGGDVTPDCSKEYSGAGYDEIILDGAAIP